jgi:GNAT superfamily N-acetyltransferase
LGWVVRAHATIYAREYGWNQSFEALIARIVATFIEDYDPSCERCWIAEQEGRNVGSVFLVKKSKHVAMLRLLIVDPRARGLGIGRRLVDEALRFAREAGYRKCILWTHSILHAARRIYEETGFVKVSEEPHSSWGPDVVGEHWELQLSKA